MDFNLSGLEPWQAELFIEAGRSGKIEIIKNDFSKNKSYFKKFDGKAGAFLARYEMFQENGEKFYHVYFNGDKKWVDCSKTKSGGWNFQRVSEHELGHVRGRKHTINPFSIMYGPEEDPFHYLYPEMDFCQN